jgi:hypothetical protein
VSFCDACLDRNHCERDRQTRYSGDYPRRHGAESEEILGSLIAVILILKVAIFRVWRLIPIAFTAIESALQLFSQIQQFRRVVFPRHHIRDFPPMSSSPIPIGIIHSPTSHSLIATVNFITGVLSPISRLCSASKTRK